MESISIAVILLSVSCLLNTHLIMKLRKLIIRQEQDTIGLQQFVIEYLSRMERRP